MVDTRLFVDLRGLLAEQGAAVVGCADLAPLPAEVRQSMPRGLSIGVALAPAVVAGIVEGPTEAYAAEYERVNVLLDHLGRECAAFLRRRGFRAAACRPTVAELDEDFRKTLTTALPHIGKCALLVSETHGSAVRYNTVLSDAPLPAGSPVETSACGDCTACADVCPVGAPLGPHWHAGLERAAFFDAFACCEQATREAQRIAGGHAICGICIAACPFTRQYLVESGCPSRQDR